MKKLLINSILVLLLIATANLAHEPLYLYEYKGSSVVMLTGKRSGGTGFRVKTEKGNTFILTNAHICRIADTLTATYGNDGEKDIKVIEIYEDHDLCIMEDIDEIPSLSIADTLRLREKVYLIGHPALRPLTLESGYFVGTMDIGLWTKCPKREVEKQMRENRNPTLGEYLMYMASYCTVNMEANHINNIAYGGNSGSPVLDKWGNVVGVLFAGSRSQNTASFIVPLHEIHTFLEDK